MKLVMGDKFTREDVFNQITPIGDDLNSKHPWVPIPHKTLIETVENSLAEYGFSISAEDHALSDNGLCWFGGYSLKKPDLDGSERNLVLGVRNSNNKRFAAGICIGNRMIVCDNLCFSSDHKIQKKHTRNVLNNMPGAVSSIIGQLMNEWQNMSDRISHYKEFSLSEEKCSKLIMDLLRDKVLSGPDAFPAFSLFRNPSLDAEEIIPRLGKDASEEMHENRLKLIASKAEDLENQFGGRNLWSLQNAITARLRGYTHDTVLKRTMQMQGMFDSLVGIKKFEEAQDAVILAG